MAITKSNVLRKRIGDKVYKLVNGQQVVAQLPAMVKQPRTSAQMAQRAKWPNVIAMFRAFSPYAKLCFEFKGATMSDYNRFVQLNLMSNNVYIDKSIAQQKGGIAALYMVSQGTLDSIVVTGEGINAASDINVGSITIDDKTTVKAFSDAVVSANPGRFEYGDQITFIMFKQLTDATNEVPYIKCVAAKVVLNGQSDKKLWDIVDKTGFFSKDGKLTVSATLPQCTFAWIHSRKTLSGKTLVSSQRLQNNNTMLSEYMTEVAKTATMKSYGVNSPVYITPDTNGTSTGAAGGGSSSGGGSNSGGAGGDSGSDPL